MAVFKCKMCGGNLEAAEGQNIGTCDSCGSTMTLPKANDERIVNLFNRATHYRQQNEFDKAIATYESILEEDNENAEAYWGLVLSKYGIEYVEDPKTHKRIPTCHRLQHTSILADLDYQSALKYAIDYDAEKLYKNEAETISEIQKNILSVANNEEAYDIFICYKETDNSGKRTMDSVLAQDIYSQLINEGYKVFFSKITLEDKLGQEYEPYIFSALNSAKVMLVVGTDKDNFNAVWVKNEWSRFLALSRKDKNKVIIPCYKDMDAYDLPDELSMFQSQDMNKIGFLQDLIRGIKKVMQNENKQTARNTDNKKNTFQTEPLLKRAFLLLEEAEWQKADDLLEQVLNHDPENAKAYLGKLMIELQVNQKDDLRKITDNLSMYPSFQKALQFADDKLHKELEEYKSLSMDLLENEQTRLLALYEIEIQKTPELERQKHKKTKLGIGMLITPFIIWILVGIISMIGVDMGDIVIGCLVLICILILIGAFPMGIFPALRASGELKRNQMNIGKLKCSLYEVNSKLNESDVNNIQSIVLNWLKNDMQYFKQKTLITPFVLLRDIQKQIGIDYEKAKHITDRIIADVNNIANTIRQQTSAHNSSALQSLKVEELEKQITSLQKNIDFMEGQKSKNKKVFTVGSIIFIVSVIFFIVAIMLKSDLSFVWGATGGFGFVILFIGGGFFLLNNNNISEAISKKMMFEEEIKNCKRQQGVKNPSQELSYSKNNIVVFTHTCSKCSHIFKVKYNKPENQDKISALSVICPKCKSKEIIKEKNL